MSRVSPSNRIQGRTTTNLVKESGPLPLCPSYRGLASVSPLLPSSTIPFPPPTVFAYRQRRWYTSTYPRSPTTEKSSSKARRRLPGGEGGGGGRRCINPPSPRRVQKLLQRLTPADPCEDPYLVALLIAMAQE